MSLLFLQGKTFLIPSSLVPLKSCFHFSYFCHRSRHSSKQEPPELTKFLVRVFVPPVVTTFFSFSYFAPYFRSLSLRSCCYTFPARKIHLNKKCQRRGKRHERLISPRFIFGMCCYSCIFFLLWHRFHFMHHFLLMFNRCLLRSWLISMNDTIQAVHLGWQWGSSHQDPIKNSRTMIYIQGMMFEFSPSR